MTAIDWSTAEVRDGDLTVMFSEPTTAPLRERMKALVNRLQRPGEPWQGIKVKKDRLIVGGIADSGEDDVRHFVESLVQEANAAEADGAPEPEQIDERDRRMTDAFQAFAPRD
jgi:hypothetical protein